MKLKTSLVNFQPGQDPLLTDSVGIGDSTPAVRSVVPKGAGAGLQGYKPVDLLAMAAASCTLSMVVTALDGRGIDPTGSHVVSNYEMVDNPRRMGKLHLVIHLPKAIAGDEKLHTVLLRTAQKCPVAASLNEGMEKLVEIAYDI